MENKTGIAMLTIYSCVRTDNIVPSKAVHVFLESPSIIANNVRNLYTLVPVQTARRRHVSLVIYPQ